MAEKILELTLEIISLLTGEDYTVVRKTSTTCVTNRSPSHVTQSPIMETPVIHGSNNEERILEVTGKIIELLTGEVPIRCQDVTVYFSMEEWEYVEGHKDLYQDIMIDHYNSLSPTDGPSKRSKPQRCPSPLYPGNDQVDEANTFTLTLLFLYSLLVSSLVCLNCLINFTFIVPLF
ncbi:gastrula zinc finger protein XlCGF66.1-like [Eleutherodactylus coqui]|uniref:gastrula zinc finger protein XlCGF66.1-like n=1 Tax=Eleutherodactylus coqui TaxID=57060 RepID=UPI0034628510